MKSILSYQDQYPPLFDTFYSFTWTQSQDQSHPHRVSTVMHFFISPSTGDETELTPNANLAHQHTARLRSTDLPEVDDGPSFPIPKVTENTDIATLTPAQLYDLNQDLFNDSVPTRPLIDEVAPMSVLRAEYENGSPSFLQQIDSLSAKGFEAIRRARGDGDCFYRSVAFAYVERVLHAPDLALAAASAVSTLESTLLMLEKAGFQRLVFEDFYEVFADLVKNIVQPDPRGRKLNPQLLLESFQSPEVSNSIVVYLRLLTSAQIRTDPDSYAPFLFHPELGIQLEPREFCENFVEAVGKEADHVQITALSRALQINVNIAYLDGRTANVDFVEFRNATDTGTNPLILLYRPGHYDILLGPDDKRMGAL